jgi:hypothetical protein
MKQYKNLHSAQAIAIRPQASKEKITLYIFLVLILILSSVSYQASAQTTYVWNGSVDNSWTEPGNWNPNRVSSATTDILVFSIGGNLVVESIITEDIGKLKVTNNTSLTLRPLAGSNRIIKTLSSAADALVVESGSFLNIQGNTSSKLTIRLTAGQGHVSGVVRPGTYNGGVGAFERSGTGVLYFYSGGEYCHFINGGAIPAATWNDGSLCRITGVVNTCPAFPSDHSFYNLVWNCPGQGNISLSSNITTRSDFTIKSTGSNLLRVSASPTLSYTINVGGNYIQEAGRFRLNESTGGVTMTVNGNFSLTGGNFDLSFGESNTSLSVGGNFTMSGSSSLLFSNSAYYGSLSVGGNFTHSGGTIYESSSGYGEIIFNGSGVQIYTSGGTVAPSTVVNFVVNSGSILQMGTSVSPSVISSDYTGTFTLSSGATLVITSPEGITNFGATGNIQNTTRNYSTGANYIYAGSGAQVTGAGLPTGAITGNITINTGAEVTPTTNIQANGTLTVNGTLVPGSASYIFTGTGTLTGAGTVRVTRTASTADFATQYAITNKTLTNLTVEYSVLTGGQVISPLTYSNLVLKNTSGTVTSGGNFTVNGTLLTTAGGTLNLGTNQVTVNNLVNNGSVSLNSTTLSDNGSLIINSASGTGLITYDRLLRSEANDGDFHFIGSPVANNTATNSTKVSKVYYYNEVTGEWTETVMTALASGRGYNIDQTTSSNGLITFTGSPVTGDVTFDATSPYANTFNGTDYSTRTFADGSGHSSIVRNNTDAYGAGGWNLMGNPYTSAIDAEAFVDYNNDHFDPNYKAVYIYDGTVGEKGVYKYIAPSVPNEPDEIGSFGSSDIQVGQGFFVLAMNDYSTFTFTPAMRGHNGSVAMTKSSGDDPWPGVNLRVRYGDNVSSTVMVFNDEMKPGLDPGYDIGLLSTWPAVEIFTTLVANDNGVWFARQALPVVSGQDNIIPVGLATENGATVTFSADVLPMAGYTDYLEDRLTGTFTDLHTDSYTATIPHRHTAQVASIYGCRIILSPRSIR